jgi:hypothetical protein
LTQVDEGAGTVGADGNVDSGTRVCLGVSGVKAVDGTVLDDGGEVPCELLFVSTTARTTAKITTTAATTPTIHLPRLLFRGR